MPQVKVHIWQFLQYNNTLKKCVVFMFLADKKVGSTELLGCKPSYVTKGAYYTGIYLYLPVFMYLRAVTAILVQGSDPSQFFCQHWKI